MWLWVFLLLSATSFVVMIINSLKISNFNHTTGTASLLQTAEIKVESKASKIESLLIRGQAGNKLPKTAYWIIARADTNADSKEMILKMKLEPFTDSSRFLTDVETGRVGYIFSPGINVIYKAVLSTVQSDEKGIYKDITLTAANAADSTPPAEVFGASEKAITVIGVPSALLS
jgi:hypothetical protein